jgi:hypothetical protein
MQLLKLRIWGEECDREKGDGGASTEKSGAVGIGGEEGK